MSESPKSLGETLAENYIGALNRYAGDSEAIDQAAFERSLEIQPVAPKGLAQLPPLNPDGSLQQSSAETPGADESKSA